MATVVVSKVKLIRDSVELGVFQIFGMPSKGSGFVIAGEHCFVSDIQWELVGTIYMPVIFLVTGGSPGLVDSWPK